jgi:hypothetical protein
LSMTADGGRLKAMLGECALDIAPNGPDAFKVMRLTFHGVTLKFDVQPAGKATAVRLEDEEPIVVIRGQG